VNRYNEAFLAAVLILRWALPALLSILKSLLADYSGLAYTIDVGLKAATLLVATWNVFSQAGRPRALRGKHSARFEVRKKTRRGRLLAALSGVTMFGGQLLELWLAILAAG
jgi:hypothetical protein